jgi:acetolactate synthase-1/2/3 large subunit
MRLSGARILWECLLKEGVDTVFGYPGGAVLPAYDALLDVRIRHVRVRHEQGGCHAADGYARATGRVGVVLATSGPGATNLVTGLATAMLDSVPLVAITGQVSSKLLGTDAFQEVDVTGVTLPVTKHNYLVTEVEELATTLAEAFQVAREGRPGPVLVDITKDVQQAFTEYDPDHVPQRRKPRPMPRPSEAALDQAAALIQQSLRPLILAGHGIQLSGAREHVQRMAATQDAPYATTLLGLGAVPAHHALSLGMMGMHGEAWVNQAIQEADLLLAFGMRFDDRVTGRLKDYAPQAKKLHVDIDASEFNKNVPVDLTLHGDLRDVLEALLPRLEPRRREGWLTHLRDLRGDASVRDIQQLPDEGQLLAPHVIHDLWKLTEGDAIVVTDVGQHQMWEAQYWPHDDERSLITSGGLGTMGFALPAGIGAQMGRPDREVWVIAGDGGFQMTSPELMTAVQEGLPLRIAVINNGHLGMVRQWQEFFFDRRYASSPIQSPDFVKLAEAYGVKAFRVDQRSEIARTVAQARSHAGPALIEFVVAQEDSVFPMVPAGAALHEMIRRPIPSALVETGSDDVVASVPRLR